MMALRIVLVLGVSFAALAGLSSRAHAEGRFIDDPLVLPARRARLGIGFGAVLVHRAQNDLAGDTYIWGGAGASLDQALGIGHGLELGARFGVRFPSDGRGVRADEVARLTDTETYGTGLSLTANPELRLRARLARWGATEAAVSERLVLPIHPDPDLTEVLGVQLAQRLGEFVRLDLGVNGVLSFRSLESGWMVEPTLALPLAIWANATRRLFFGMLGSARVTAATRLTRSQTRLLAAAAVGYRLHFCDVIGQIATPQLVPEGVERWGVGFGLACTL